MVHSLKENAFWFIQCTSYISKVHDAYLSRYGWANYRSIHGWFSVSGPSFYTCLHNFNLVLQRCEDTNLVIIWEKCHFMKKERIVLGHRISEKGIEVDRAKTEIIEKLPYPINVRGVRSVLGHAWFYQRFIRDFSKNCKTFVQFINERCNI